jgi:shikimate 5-dehydrogenase
MSHATKSTSDGSEGDAVIAMPAPLKVPIHINSNTKYIISTSGRLTSLKRYDLLLNTILSTDIAYIPITDSKISPQNFIWAFKGLKCIGGAISRDIKFTIIPFLDRLDPTADSVQSVNTVVEEDGQLVGYNTDVSGFKAAIINGIAASKLPIRSAVCYGYGGVISVVVAVLKKLGIAVYITGRRPEEAARRSVELGAEVFDKDKHCPDLFINAAPISNQELSEVPNFLCSLDKCKIVFDHEMPGNVLKDHCKIHGKYHISGYDMYYPQMTLQWGLFLRHLYLESSQIESLLRKAELLANNNEK